MVPSKILYQYQPDVYSHVFNSSKSFSTVWFRTNEWFFSSVHSKMINKLILSTKPLHISRATSPAAIICGARIAEITNSISSRREILGLTCQDVFGNVPQIAFAVQNKLHRWDVEQRHHHHLRIDPIPIDK